MDRRGHFGPRLCRWIPSFLLAVCVFVPRVSPEEHYSSARKNCRVDAEVSLPRGAGKKVKGRPSWAGWQVGGGGKLLAVRGSALTRRDPATGAEAEVQGGLPADRQAQAAEGPAGLYVLSAPALGSAVVEAAKLTAYSSGTANPRWSVIPFPLVDLPLLATPVASAQRVHVGVADQAAAFDASSGAKVWARSLPGHVGCCPALDGSILVQPTSKGLVAMDTADGGTLWTRAMDVQDFNPVRGPAIDGGRVYFAFEERTVSALDLATGKLLWTSPVLPRAVDHRHPPVVGPGGVLVPLYEGLARLSPDGTLVWAKTYDFLKMRSGNPALLAAANAAFLGGADGLHAVSLATGEELWSAGALGQVIDVEYFATELVAETSSGDVVTFGPGNP